MRRGIFAASISIYYCHSTYYASVLFLRLTFPQPHFIHWTPWNTSFGKYWTEKLPCIRIREQVEKYIFSFKEIFKKKKKKGKKMLSTYLCFLFSQSCFMKLKCCSNTYWEQVQSLERIVFCSILFIEQNLGLGTQLFLSNCFVTFHA